MKASERRYDIDWLRVIAIALLLIYHAAIVFQPWGALIGFIVNQESLVSLWIPMSMLNVWRIPLLFFVSGMGFAFAMRKRNWKQLLMERFRRIMIPLVFGMLIIVPLYTFIWQSYYNQTLSYVSGRGHLWFLANIMAYVVIALPLAYLVRRFLPPGNKWIIKRVLTHPLGLLVLILPFVLEVLWIKPASFELYAMTWHGFYLGLLAFLSGLVMVKSGSAIWEMLSSWMWGYLVAGMVLFMVRLMYYQLNAPAYLKAIESVLWIYSFFGLASRYLNKPGRLLSYLSQAAYPVYILHMVFLYLGAVWIVPLSIHVFLKYIFVTFLSFAGSFVFYELLVRRISFVGVCFGLKMKSSKSSRKADVSTGKVKEVSVGS